jgi:hypothetical protein
MDVVLSLFGWIESFSGDALLFLFVDFAVPAVHFLFCFFHAVKLFLALQKLGFTLLCHIALQKKPRGLFLQALGLAIQNRIRSTSNVNFLDSNVKDYFPLCDSRIGFVVQKKMKFFAGCDFVVAANVFES